MNPFACLLLAAALALLPSSTRARSRLVVDSRTSAVGLRSLAKLSAPRAVRNWFSLGRKTRNGDPLRKAAGWDLFAVAMRSGLPVPTAVRAVAKEFDEQAATVLCEVADRLSWGADPVSAWEPAFRHPDTADFARAARRAARTGSALAAVAADIAGDTRESLRSQAEARAQRATVWVSAPLGLCFLPGFVCLGVAPVVVGMAQRLMWTW